jgi:predicted nicotinamide N-methyase
VSRFGVKGVLKNSHLFFYGGRLKKTGLNKNPLFFAKFNLYNGNFIQKDLGFANNVSVDIVLLGEKIISKKNKKKINKKFFRKN